MNDIDKITKLLGEDADSLLNFNKPKISKKQLHLPGPDWLDTTFAQTDRPITV